VGNGGETWFLIVLITYSVVVLWRLMEVVGEADKHLPLFSDTASKQRPAPL